MTMKSGKILNVLLLEDDPLVRVTGRRVLENLGYEVSEAEDCREAAALWAAGTYSLIIADYRLPDGFGTDLVNSMRQAGRKEPVICLTAESDHIPDDQRVTLGVSGVLIKPIDFKSLEKIVTEVLAGDIIRSGNCVGKPDLVGKFTVVRCSAELEAGIEKEILSVAGGNAWVALDLTKTDSIENGAAEVLAVIGSDLIARGGCLCLVGLRSDLKKKFISGGKTAGLDMVSNETALLALSRSPNLISERASVLRSVVFEEGKTETGGGAGNHNFTEQGP